LRTEARHVKIGQGDQARAIFDISRATLRDCHAYFQSLQLEGAKAAIADKVVREIGNRLKFLNDVGLNYLSLDRSAETLSGGEAQRIRLASQIGSGLTGVMYVLDEPCTSVTTTAWSTRSSICETSATACWWSNTTKT
jgi:excinuclease ABC subunit A